MYWLLEKPSVYRLFNAVIGGKMIRRFFIQHYLKPQSGQRILDVGCGTGELLEVLPKNINYIGFDANSKYIAQAKKKFGIRGLFIQKRIEAWRPDNFKDFSAVLAFGVLHHLPDDLSLHMLQMAKLALSNVRGGGKLLTLDGCFKQGQHVGIKWLLEHDRGHFVRTKEMYIELASSVFNKVDWSFYSGPTRIPYTAIVLECS